MCRRVTCPKCGKPDWEGCGAHIEQVLGDVPQADRCQGHDEEIQPEPPPGELPRRRSWFSRLLGS